MPSADALVSKKNDKMLEEAEMNCLNAIAGSHNTQPLFENHISADV